MKLSLKKIKSENGQSVVEFALVIPLLLIIILGILEFGWILNAQITLTSAARESARAAAVSTVDKENRAFNAAVAAVDASGITLTHDADHFGYSVEEDITNNVSNVVIDITGDVAPLIGLFVGNPYQIQAKAVMRLE